MVGPILPLDFENFRRIKLGPELGQQMTVDRAQIRDMLLPHLAVVTLVFDKRDLKAVGHQPIGQLQQTDAPTAPRFLWTASHAASIPAAARTVAVALRLHPAGLKAIGNDLAITDEHRSGRYIRSAAVCRATTAAPHQRTINMADIHCVRCGYHITWADQRRQFGRLMRLGFGYEDAKALMPRCQKCVTTTLREHPGSDGACQSCQ